MADYINREQALRLSEQVTQYDEGGWDRTIKAIPVTELMKLPAADVVPAKHAHWIPKAECGYPNRIAECSRCGYQMPYPGETYCPHCGAEMDEEGKNGRS